MVRTHRKAICVEGNSPAMADGKDVFIENDSLGPRFNQQIKRAPGGETIRGFAGGPIFLSTGGNHGQNPMNLALAQTNTAPGARSG